MRSDNMLGLIYILLRGEIGMPTPILLTEEECYCELDEFYARVAQHLGYDISYNDEKHKFDCRKIRITPSVFSKIKQYYMKENGDLATTVALLFVVCGPKASVLEFPDHRYIAEVDDGFVVEE